MSSRLWVTVDSDYAGRPREQRLVELPWWRCHIVGHQWRRVDNIGALYHCRNCGGNKHSDPTRWVREL